MQPGSQIWGSCQKYQLQSEEHNERQNKFWNSEIILDFARVMPNQSKSKIQSRVVMTPLNAKLLLRALTENLQRYETQYGAFNIPENIIIDPNRGFTR